MDIYARCKNLDKVESLFENTSNPDIVKYGVLIKAYAHAGRIDGATKVLRRMLQDSHVEPNVIIFNTLLDAWAGSSESDAVEQAFSVLQLMEQDGKCLELGIRPDAFTFNALLKCLAASARSDAGKRAEDVLGDMERRYRAGDTRSKPNAITYNLAIKACFQAGDPEKADAVMKRMEKSDTPPNVRTYNDILQHYSQIGTSAAAERAEQILAYMKDLAKSTPSLKPNTFSYSIVLAAWARSGDPNAANRMWKIYEQMATDQIDLDTFVYTSFISFLAKSRKLEDVERADLLLQSMENSNRRVIQPDSRHFTSVVKGYANRGSPESATRILIRSAEAYMKGKNDEAKPIPLTFYWVTKAWIRSGNLEKATLIVKEMQELRDRERLPEGPDVRTYQMLLSAWSKSTHPKKYVYTANLTAMIAHLSSSKHGTLV
jgi:pentatricopeptide repeat protein